MVSKSAVDLPTQMNVKPESWALDSVCDRSTTTIS